MNTRTALVFPYFPSGDGSRLLFQPLGIATLATCLSRIGMEARQFDCTFTRFDEAVSEIAKYEPHIVGISVMATMFWSARSLLRKLKPLLPQACFVAGGPLPTLFPVEFGELFDVVMTGEAVESFPAFVRDYAESGSTLRNFHEKTNLGSYPGVRVRNRHSEISVPARIPGAEALDILPDRSGGEPERYQAEWYAMSGRKPAAIMTTYGCPYSCDFCSKPVFGSRFRKRGVRPVMNEIRDIERIGYDSLWIADDCFTLDPSYLGEICNALIDEPIGNGWSCLSRVDKVTPEIAWLMKAAGCFKVYLGLESGSDSTLALMGKRTTVAQGAEAVRVFNEAGIKTAGFFMVGYPGERMDSVKKTLDFALALRMDEISFTVPYPLPGSPLYERTGSGGIFADWRTENEVKFLYDSEFDTNTLKRMIDDTMREFKRRKSTNSNRFKKPFRCQTP